MIARLTFLLPSKRRLESFSSRVSSSLAALRIFARVNFTLHTSLLFLSPYSPTGIKKCYDNAITGQFIQEPTNQRLQAALTNEFQLLVETGLLEGTAGGNVCLTTYPTLGNGHGGLFTPEK